jgi:hypothetical protein
MVDFYLECPFISYCLKKSMMLTFIPNKDMQVVVADNIFANVTNTVFNMKTSTIDVVLRYDPSKTFCCLC